MIPQRGASAVLFFLYLLFMIPTYVLPYLGSNSAVLGAAGASAGFAFSPQFILHFISLLVLIGLSHRRGKVVDKQWIVIFPIIATFFDMMPGINLIPLIPTVIAYLCASCGCKRQEHCGCLNMFCNSLSIGFV